MRALLSVLALGINAYLVAAGHGEGQTQAPFGPGGEGDRSVTGPSAMVTYDEVVPRMDVVPLAVGKGRRVDLAVFSDGYTSSERDKFLADARKLVDDVVGEGPFTPVRDLVNVWGVFVASNVSGLGHNDPLPGSPFGLYRDGPELRGVYVGHPGRARAACRALRKGSAKVWGDGDGVDLDVGLGVDLDLDLGIDLDQVEDFDGADDADAGDLGHKHKHKHKRGGCDHAVLLGNSALYGGLGGEFTVITASPRNGKLVLAHELGHSLIPVGEEYDGGYVYCGVNADSADNVNDLKWKKHLSAPKDVRVEDAKVPIQAYPWQNLDDSTYRASFLSSNTLGKEPHYTSGLLSISLSSIPYPTHVNVTISGVEIDLSPGFPYDWDGTLDRRWVEVRLPTLGAGGHELRVELTPEGRAAKPGEGGKMVTSVEIIEYAHDFNFERDFVGAFPTYDEKGGMTLRPTNEDCLMRRTTHPSFCTVCAHELKHALKKMIKNKKKGKGKRNQKWAKRCVVAKPAEPGKDD